MSENVQTIERVLLDTGVYVGVLSGKSMQPTITERIDTVVVKRKTDKLQLLDVALFKRDGEYVLHRVVKVLEDGYLMRGDNCYTDEWVEETEVLGVLTEFFKGEKRILCTDNDYLRLVKRRMRFYPLRRFFVHLKAYIYRIFKK